MDALKDDKRCRIFSITAYLNVIHYESLLFLLVPDGHPKQNATTTT